MGMLFHSFPSLKTEEWKESEKKCNSILRTGIPGDPHERNSKENRVEAVGLVNFATNNMK
jgi:hypothetical protein